eukprot:9302120-Alexandrium_andersonii.AAC.1
MVIVVGNGCATHGGRSCGLGRTAGQLGLRMLVGARNVVRLVILGGAYGVVAAGVRSFRLCWHVVFAGSEP